MGKTISRRYARDDMDPSMPPGGSGDMDKLGGVLKAAGIMDDDIAHVIELLMSAEAVDAAPPASSPDRTDYSGYSGGGTYDPDESYSGRTYTPTDGSSGSANDRRRGAMDGVRGMALDAHTEKARRYVHEAVDRRFARFAAGQISHEDLWRYGYSPPPPTERERQAFDQAFPHIRRLG